MSGGELLLTLLVALLVFGPSKLPMLAHHLGKLMHKYHQLKGQVNHFWIAQEQEMQLQENLKKAKQAEAPTGSEPQ